MDTARADAFEPYGAPRGSTPAAAQLASRGMHQQFAYAPASWTVPSHASMFTGLLPRDMGLGQAPGGSPLGVRPVIGAPRGRRLPERLRRAGWHTVGISANHWIAEHSGFATGFDEWHQVVSGRSNRFSADGWWSRARWGFECVRAHIDDGAAEAERIIDQLLASRDPDRPFFWFVNLIECHSPYLPPRPQNGLSLVQRLRAADEARRHLTFQGIIEACTGTSEVPEPALERMRHLYARSVRSMDDWLGRVLDALDGSKVLDETHVIVTSDHGENLGEDGLLGHAFSLDDRLIRVPLISSTPLAGSTDVLSLRDLPRLLATAVGLDDHPWEGSGEPSGVAVAQLDPLAPADDPRVTEYVERSALDERGALRFTTGAVVAPDGRRKLLRRGGTDVLFDLVEDPMELRGAPLDRLGARDVGDLVAAVDAAEEPHPGGSLPGAGTTAAASDEEVARIDEQMRLLGY